MNRRDGSKAVRGRGAKDRRRSGPKRYLQMDSDLPMDTGLRAQTDLQQDCPGPWVKDFPAPDSEDV